jgi:phospholipid-binding lipoprotein MlaA
VAILSIIDKRARLSGPMRIRDQAALDPYLFVREGYLQQRKHLIYDGHPPPESYEDPLEDAALQNEQAVEPSAKPSSSP